MSGAVEAPISTRRRRRLLPPGALVLRLFLLVSWLWFALPWLYALVTDDGNACYHLTPAAVHADLSSIGARLDAGEDEAMHKFFPEGRLFAHSFYGFTLVNVAVSNPADKAFGADVVKELKRQIALVESLGAQAPFDQERFLVPKGGIIAAGHANLLRAGYVLLGGRDAKILADFDAQSEVLANAFGKSKTGSLESYGGQIWPVDNLVALESLRLHDVLRHTAYARTAQRWAQWMSAHKDPATGLFNMQITEDGDVLDGPRGCGLSWTFAFLPPLAPALAQKQYALYRKTWFANPLGTAGIREFPPGRNNTFVDSDTGPIFFGLGTAATGFGIAAAKANHDTANLTALLRALDLCSFPMYTKRLGHERFFGQVLLADEIALWGSTLARWDSPAVLPPPLPPPALHDYWIVLASVSVLCLGVTMLLVHSVLRVWQMRREWPRPLPRWQGALFGVSLLVVPAYLVVASVPWVMALVALGLLEALATRIRPLGSR